MPRIQGTRGRGPSFGRLAGPRAAVGTLLALAGLIDGPAPAQAAFASGEAGVRAEAGREEALDAALDDWARQSGHRGVSAAVVFADRRLWTGAAGLAADGEQLRPDHLIWIASVTKTMVGAVILQLVAEKRLSLEDPVARWLPPRDAVDPSITVRQLLDHSNGLDNYTANPALQQAVIADPRRVFSRHDLLGFAGEPDFPPGERTRYTNTSFLLLSEIAEAAGKKPILELLRVRIYKRNKLREVFLPFAEPPPGPVAAALGPDGLVDPLDRPARVSVGSTAFGLMATARDVARWGAALFRGGVLPRRLQNEMRRLAPAAGNIPGETGVGLGIRGYEFLGRTQFGHSGGASYGSSLLLFDPATNVTVAVLMNQGQGADHFELAPALLEIASSE